MTGAPFLEFKIITVSLVTYLNEIDLKFSIDPELKSDWPLKETPS